MRILGLLITAVPLCFGALRAATTGTDFRYLWAALASTIAAGLVLGVRERTSAPAAGRVLGGFVAAAAVAGGVGLAQGAQSLPAVLAVATAFAICATAGFALLFRARAG